jgi:hypothetical protein
MEESFGNKEIQFPIHKIRKYFLSLLFKNISALFKIVGRKVIDFHPLFLLYYV